MKAIHHLLRHKDWDLRDSELRVARIALRVADGLRQHAPRNTQPAAQIHSNPRTLESWNPFNCIMISTF
jgi:hypothetical protein